MKIEVFDDKKSLFHAVIGIVAFFFPVIFIVFIFYEITEFLYYNREEPVENFIGDIMEVCMWLSFTALAIKTL